MKRSELKEAITKIGYQNPEQTTKDVVSVLTAYRGLMHCVEPFVFNDGNQKELVKVQGTIPVPYKVFQNGHQKMLCGLKGTVPVPYKGQNYHIPVCIWLMDTHPNNAPICYVKPTADMRIKVSMNVDHNGKVYLPYLHSWNPRRSDLMALVQVMICAFSDEPPVYSKPKKDSQSQPASVPYPTQPYMPVPGGSANPPYPPATTSAYPSGSTPYPQTQHPQYPSPYPSYHPFQPPNVSLLPYPPYPSMGGPKATPELPVVQNSGADAGTGTITEEHIRASLMSAVEDKMRRALRDQSGHSRAQLDILRQSHSELQRGKTRLDDILSRLTKEQEELDKNIAMLKDKENELSKAVERLTEQDPVDVDEAVTTTAPLYKQILNAYAEEAATEDTIYYMGEALRRGVIDLDVFLKQVRSLSRKQFMLRALMQKCRLKAGLK